MKHFFIVFFVFNSWIHAQIVHDVANWPNPAWDVTGSYSVSGFVSDPRTTPNFSWDDDAAGGNGSNSDIIQAESPMINLNPAFTGGEQQIQVSFNYVYQRLGDYLSLQWWNQATNTWEVWEILSTNSSNTDYKNCTGMQTFISTPLIIATLSSLQLSNFKYRIQFDDRGLDWGFCMDSPTLTSITSPSCFEVSNIIIDPASITTDSAVINWTDNNTTTPLNGWEIEYGPIDFTQGTGITVVANLHPFTLSNLIQDTNYDVYIRAMCSATEQSEWNNVTNFKTKILSPVCGGVFLDDGGINGNYSGANFIQTICSDTANNVVSVQFSKFDTEKTDILRVYDGANTNAPLLGEYSGTNVPPTFTSTGTCLTFDFIPDSSNNDFSGWEASVFCNPASEMNCLAPTNLYKPTLSDFQVLDEINITWSNPSTNDPNVTWKLAIKPEGEPISDSDFTLTSTTTNFTFTGLQTDTTYAYYVRTNCGTNKSYWSKQVFNTIGCNSFSQIILNNFYSLYDVENDKIIIKFRYPNNLYYSQILESIKIINIVNNTTVAVFGGNSSNPIPFPDSNGYIQFSFQAELNLFNNGSYKVAFNCKSEHGGGSLTYSIGNNGEKFNYSIGCNNNTVRMYFSSTYIIDNVFPDFLTLRVTYASHGADQNSGTDIFVDSNNIFFDSNLSLFYFDLPQLNNLDPSVTILDFYFTICYSNPLTCEELNMAPITYDIRKNCIDSNGCNTPDITNTSTTDTTMYLSWQEQNNPPAIAWQVGYALGIGFTDTDYLDSSIFTTITVYEPQILIEDLIPSNTYTFFVKAICDPANNVLSNPAVVVTDTQCTNCTSFTPTPGKEYVISGWVKEDWNISPQVTLNVAESGNTALVKSMLNNLTTRYNLNGGVPNGTEVAGLLDMNQHDLGVADSQKYFHPDLLQACTNNPSGEPRIYNFQYYTENNKSEFRFQYTPGEYYWTDNLIVNGGFENGYFGWNAYEDPDFSTPSNCISTPALTGAGHSGAPHSGENFLWTGHETDDGCGDTYIRQIIDLSNYLTDNGDCKYKFSSRIKGHNRADLQKIEIRFYDRRNGNQLRVDTVAIHDVNEPEFHHQVWIYFSIEEEQIPAGAKEAIIVLIGLDNELSYNNYPENDSFFDDIFFSVRYPTFDDLSPVQIYDVDCFQNGTYEQVPILEVTANNQYPEEKNYFNLTYNCNNYTGVASKYRYGDNVFNTTYSENTNFTKKQVPNYDHTFIQVNFLNNQNEGVPDLFGDAFKQFNPSGEIIDGWQRIQGVFMVPANTVKLQIELVNNLNGDANNNENPANPDDHLGDAYFDDIRIFPKDGNMKSFVYDPVTQKLMAELDENNFATFYEYDKEGGLIRVKKETEKGIFTIQETRSGNAIKE